MALPHRARSRRVALGLAVLALLAAACGSPGDDATPIGTTDAAFPRTFGPAPDVPLGPLAPPLEAALDRIAGTREVAPDDPDLAALMTADDPRVAWLVADLLRFVPPGSASAEAYRDAATTLVDAAIDADRPWTSLTDHLIAWDLPAYPGYADHKEALYTAVEPRWAFVFDDADSEIDLRLLAWGGVLIDDRPLGDTNPCVVSCIPSLDDPALTAATEGGWYPDEAVVFGVEIDGDAVAFPRNVMEVHEMVNTTVGGRRIAMPYCTLCGSAQVFLTDEVPGEVPGVARPPVLRTSGLLSRSNKVMYDLDSRSVFDTFTGRAVAGPLRAAGVTLPQATVVTTTWLDWRTTHPDTRIVAEDGGIGRRYALDPLGGRDDDGPIFPIGEVDPRLPVQEPVLGVLLDDGTPVAIPVAAARSALQAGRAVTVAGVDAVLVGDGLAAEIDGEPVTSHQAFWFAWSQFHPGTELWPG